MKCSIRKAEIRDAASISELSGQLGYASSISQTQNRLTHLLKNKDNCVYVAVDNEKVIGWIHGFHTFRVESDPFIEIGGLVVSEHYRKMGVGKILVEQLYHWANSKACKKLRVRCNEVRKESHAFYENLGFELHKVQKIFGKTLS